MNVDTDNFWRGRGGKRHGVGMVTQPDGTGERLLFIRGVPSLSLLHSHFLSLSPPPCLALSRLSLSLYVSILHSLSDGTGERLLSIRGVLSLSYSGSLPPSSSLSLSFFLSLSPSLCPCLSLFLLLHPSLSLSLSLYPSRSLSLSRSLSFFVSPCLCPSLSLSQTARENAFLHARLKLCSRERRSGRACTLRVQGLEFLVPPLLLDRRGRV